MATNCNQLPPGSKVVAYLRASGHRRQTESIPRQKDDVGEFCRANQLALIKIYADKGTGTTTAGRDQFHRMIDHLTAEPPRIQADAVLFWSYDRFARDYEDSQYYLGALRHHQYRIISMTDRVGDTLEDRLLESFHIYRSAKESQILGKRVASGMARAANRGHWTGGRAPVGYRLKRHNIGQDDQYTNLEPDPGKATLVQAAFRMRAKGKSLTEIHQTTNLLKSPRAISKLLKRKIYIGVMEYNGAEIEEYCQPIISKNLWQAAQKVNQARANASGVNHPRTVSSPYIISGLLYCKECGQKMHGTKPRPGNTYYYCSDRNFDNECRARMIPQDEIETIVIDAILETLSPENLKAIYQDYEKQTRSQAGTVVQQIQAIEEQRASTQKSIDRVVTAITESGHSQALISQLAELERKEEKLSQRITKLKTQKPPQLIPYTEYKQKRERTKQALLTGDNQLRSHALAKVIKRIDARRDAEDQIDVDIHLFAYIEPR